MPILGLVKPAQAARAPETTSGQIGIDMESLSNKYLESRRIIPISELARDIRLAAGPENQAVQSMSDIELVRNFLSSAVAFSPRWDAVKLKIDVTPGWRTLPSGAAISPQASQAVREVPRVSLGASGIKPALEKVGLKSLSPPLEFAVGFLEGVGEVGLELLTPANLAIAAAWLGAGRLATAARLSERAMKFLNALSRSGSLYIGGSSIVNALQEVPELREAFQSQDAAALGRSVGKEIANLIIAVPAIRHGVRGPRRAPPKVEKETPISEEVTGVPAETPKPPRPTERVGGPPAEEPASSLARPARAGALPAPPSPASAKGPVELGPGMKDAVTNYVFQGMTSEQIASRLFPEQVVRSPSEAIQRVEDIKRALKIPSDPSALAQWKRNFANRIASEILPQGDQPARKSPSEAAKQIGLYNYITDLWGTGRNLQEVISDIESRFPLPRPAISAMVRSVLKDQVKGTARSGGPVASPPVAAAKETTARARPQKPRVKKKEPPEAEAGPPVPEPTPQEPKPPAPTGTAEPAPQGPQAATAPAEPPPSVKGPLQPPETSPAPSPREDTVTVAATISEPPKKSKASRKVKLDETPAEPPAPRKRSVQKKPEAEPGQAGTVTPPKVPSVEVPDAARMILDEIAGMEQAPGVPVTLRALRERLPKIDRQTFDKAVTQLADEGRIYLVEHDHGWALPESERGDLLQAGGKLYVGAKLRRPLPEAATGEPAEAVAAPAVEPAPEPTIDEKAIDLARKHGVYDLIRDLGKQGSTLQQIVGAIEDKFRGSDVLRGFVVRQVLKRENIPVKETTAPTSTAPAATGASPAPSAPETKPVSPEGAPSKPGAPETEAASTQETPKASRKKTPEVIGATDYPMAVAMAVDIARSAGVYDTIVEMARKNVEVPKIVQVIGDRLPGVDQALRTFIVTSVFEKEKIPRPAASGRVVVQLPPKKSEGKSPAKQTPGQGKTSAGPLPSPPGTKKVIPVIPKGPGIAPPLPPVPLARRAEIPKPPAAVRPEQDPLAENFRDPEIPDNAKQYHKVLRVASEFWRKKEVSASDRLKQYNWMKSHYMSGLKGDPPKAIPEGTSEFHRALAERAYEAGMNDGIELGIVGSKTAFKPTETTPDAPSGSPSGRKQGPRGLSSLLKAVSSEPPAPREGKTPTGKLLLPKEDAEFERWKNLIVKPSGPLEFIEPKPEVQPDYKRAADRAKQIIIEKEAPVVDPKTKKPVEYLPARSLYEQIFRLAAIGATNDQIAVNLARTGAVLRDNELIGFIKKIIPQSSKALESGPAEKVIADHPWILSPLIDAVRWEKGLPSDRVPPEKFMEWARQKNFFVDE